jgi:hypothetical protein
MIGKFTRDERRYDQEEGNAGRINQNSSAYHRDAVTSAIASMTRNLQRPEDQTQDNEHRAQRARKP